jgi:hypothetical protein
LLLLLLVHLLLCTLLPADQWLQVSVALQQLSPQESLLCLPLPRLQLQAILPLRLRLLPGVLLQAPHHPYHQPPMQPTA